MKCRTCNNDLVTVPCPDKQPGCMLLHLWCSKCDDRVNRYLSVLRQIREAENGTASRITPREIGLLHDRRHELFAELTDYERAHVHAAGSGDVERITKERDAAITRAVSAERTLDDERDELTARIADIARLSADVERLTHELAAREFEQLTRELTEARAERDALQLRFDMSDALVGQLRDAHAVAEKDRDEWHSQFAEQTKRVIAEREAIAAELATRPAESEMARELNMARAARYVAESYRDAAVYARDQLGRDLDAAYANVVKLADERDAVAAQLAETKTLHASAIGMSNGYAKQWWDMRRERDALTARIDRVREALPHLNDVVSEFPCDGKDHEMKVFDALASVRDAIRTATGEPTFPPAVEPGSPSGRTFELITEEVKRARAKFPGTRFLLAALTEEVGEVARAYLQRQPRSKVVAEAVQVAGLAIRIIEEGDSTFDDITDEESKL